MAESKIECQSCGEEVTDILAAHNYSIYWDKEQGKWGKSDGTAVYVCSHCLEELGICDIEDILKQVDEL